MKTVPLLIVAIGLIVLLAGGVLRFTGGPPKADPALVQQCEATMKARDADASLVKQCGETAFATAMTASDAQAAARAISAANNREVGGGALSMFLIGLGLVLTLGGLFMWRAQRR